MDSVDSERKEQEEALYHAARRGKAHAAQALLDDGVDPFGFTDYQGTPALVVAAGGGHTAVVERLLLATSTFSPSTGPPGPSAGPPGPSGPSASAPSPPIGGSGAASMSTTRGPTDGGDMRMAPKVAAANPLVDTRNTFGFTAMLLAAARGHVETAALLLRHGASVDTKDSEGACLVAVECSVCCMPLSETLSVGKRGGGWEEGCVVGRGAWRGIETMRERGTRLAASTNPISGDMRCSNRVCLCVSVSVSVCGRVFHIAPSLALL